MTKILVDSNIILDLFLNDPTWGEWSETTLEKLDAHSTLCINPIIYTEISISFSHIETLEEVIIAANFQLLELPREALFLAGKAFLKYRRRGGNKRSPLPDFYIGAHAAVLNLELITRDTARYRSYFPTIKLISP
ncbi:MAG: type II toxin-antitoxin system VapC family toxin [Deltaproteobacteria bacterium]|nr:type II toxin-antitoxin system VapC family toxin [Candidatus Tharpella sp.]